MKTLYYILIGALSAFSFVSASFSQAPGNTCASAVALTSPAVGATISTGSQTTCGTANNFGAGFSSVSGSLYYGDGEDGVYSMVVPAGGGNYTFSFTGPGANFKILSIHSACTPTAANTLGGFVTDFGTGGTWTGNLPAGTVFIVIDTQPGMFGTDCGVFTLNITRNAAPCDNNVNNPGAVSVPAAICVGAAASISNVTAATGSPGSANYYFYYRGGPSNVPWQMYDGPTTNSSSTLPGAVINTPGTWFIARNSDFGCGQTANATTWGLQIIVNSASVAGTASTNQTICSGSSPSNISLAGNTGSIQWQVSTDNINFSNISGATGSTLTSAQMGSLSATRYYRAVVTNGGCSSVNSNVVTVTVNQLSVAPTSISGTNNICPATSTTLTANGGTAGYDADYVWYSSACPTDIYTQEWAIQPFGFSNTTVNSISNGILNVTSTSNDPMIDMAGLGSFNPDTYRYINIRYRVALGTANNVEIFFYNSAHNFAVGGETGVGNLVSDNTWRTLSVDMWTDPEYLTGGNIQGWRFDWATASGVTMDIDFISLSTHPILGSGSTLSVTPASTTNYYVSYKGGCNTTTCAMQTVTIQPAINYGTVASGNQTICSAAIPNSMSVSGATGSGSFIYQWYSRSGIVAAPTGSSTAAWTSLGSAAGANTATYTPASGITSSTTYACFVTPGGSPTCGTGTWATGARQVTVNPTSVGGTIAGSATVCTGTNSTVLTLSGHTGSITRWESSTSSTFASAITNIANTTTTLTATNLTTTTYYRAVVTSGVCSAVNSTTATVTVNAQPAAPGTISGTATQCPALTGQTYSIAAVSNATIYAWTVPTGWSITGGSGTTSITVTAGTAGQNGNISVTTGNSCGTSSAASLAVTVGNGTPATLGAIAGATSICPSTSTIYSVTNVAGVTYNWSYSGIGTITGSGNSISLSATTGGNLSVTASNSCGTSAAIDQSITINNPTLPTAPTNGDMVWRGGATTDWATLGNWWQYNGTSYGAASAAPTAAQNVIIPANQTCVLNQPNTFANAANAKTLHIENGANLTMGNGTLTVAENWVNNGTFTPGTGTVAFTGSGNHNVSGSALGTAGSHNFNNLTMNKNGEVILSAPIIIAGSLTLTDGRLNIVNFNLDLPTNTINGGNASSYVKTSGTGTLNRNVAGIPVSFPVGRSAYNAATLTNSGDPDKYSIRVIDNVTDIGTNADAGAPTTMAVVMRTWMINEQVAGGSNVTLGLNWNGAPEQFNGFQPPSAFVAHYIAGAGLWDNIGGTVATNSIVTSGITSFSPFTISSDLNFAPLPVELISFQANCSEDGKVEVTWATSSEHNSADFTLEKSRDGNNWSVLATLAGAGNSTQVINYSVTDNTAAEGTNYYRLTQTDFDGASETFNIASANCSESDVLNTINVYPNPSTGDFYIDFTSVDFLGASAITITDARGSEIYTQSVMVEKGSNVFHIDNMEAVPGIYYIKVSNGTATSNVVKHSLR